MNGVSSPFVALVEACRVELAAIVPRLDDARQSDAVDAIIALVALSRCHISARRRDSDVAAFPTSRPAPPPGSLAKSLLDHCAAAIAEPLRSHGKHPSFGLDSWLDDHGFLRLITALVQVDVPLDAIMALALRIGEATSAFHDRLATLATNHIAAVLKRDLDFESPCRLNALGRVLHWALAPTLSGRAERKSIIARRIQALSVYGAITTILMQDEITATIDQGQPLNPPLIRTLGVTEAHLRRLQGVRSARDALAAHRDMMGSIQTLLLHEVPLHQWPNDRDWENGLWDSQSGDSLFRPDYVGADTERRDAINALREDLLYPLAANRAEQAGLNGDYRVRRFAQGFYILSNLSHGPHHKAWLRALREAVIGPRGIKSFHEAIARWHRRSATVAAVRHEQKTDKPGWPALCPQWTAPDGFHRIVPLTSAEDLLGEGHALNHCVGGYYPQCRRGDTQIFSVRCGEERLATLELILTFGHGKALSITPGQFKARGNSRPAPQLSPVLRQFLDDLRRGRHPVAHQDLLRHHRQMQRDGDYAWRSQALPLDHARKAWPFYRTLLPKGTPYSFDQWAEQSGLTAALDDMVRTIGSPPAKH